jgi:L-fuculose-phosphate aldolase
MLSQFQAVGRELFQQGLVSSHSGNLSIRLGDRLHITKRGCMLGSIDEQDVIETGLTRNDRVTPRASAELKVHRAIYGSTPALAVVHVHPPHAVALSLTENEVVPSDSEGALFLHRVPVLGWRKKVLPGEIADEIGHALAIHRIVLVHGHGTFAVGQLLEEAYQITSALEQSCHILCILRSMGR